MLQADHKMWTFHDMTLFFGQIWKSALGAIKRSYTHRAPKFGDIRGRSEPFYWPNLALKLMYLTSNLFPWPLSLLLACSFTLLHELQHPLHQQIFLSNCNWQYRVSRKIAWQWKAMNEKQLFGFCWLCICQ